MMLTSEECGSAEALLYSLNRHKNSTISVNTEFGGINFDKEISENIRTVLTRVIKEQYAKQ